MDFILRTALDGEYQEWDARLIFVEFKNAILSSKIHLLKVLQVEQEQGWLDSVIWGESAKFGGERTKYQVSSYTVSLNQPAAQVTIVHHCLPVLYAEKVIGYNTNTS